MSTKSEKERTEELQREGDLTLARTMQLFDWRELRFLQMGVSVEHAHLLALKAGWEVDLHHFQDLREHGCSAELAERILV